MHKGNSKKVLITHSRRITGLVKGGATKSELPTGKKKHNVINMILRKSHYIFHLMKLGISIRLVDYLGNKTMRTTRRKKIEKFYIGVQT